MDPSEFFEALPELRPAFFRLPDNVDSSDEAERLVGALVASALVDFGVLTGLDDPDVPESGREREAFLCLLSAAALRAQARITAHTAVKVYNPDVQGASVPLDLVRLIGRAAQGDMQRARRLLRGTSWLRTLTDARR